MGRRQKIAPQSRNLELITSYPVISGKPKGKNLVKIIEKIRDNRLSKKFPERKKTPRGKGG